MFLSNSLFKVGCIVAGDYCVLKWCDYIQGKSARTQLLQESFVKDKVYTHPCICTEISLNEEL